MGNQALDINGFTNTVTTNNHITTRGSDWYFTVSAVMAFSMLIVMGLSFKRARPNRLFHYLFASILLVSAISYFCQGSNLGWTAIQTEFRRSDPEVAGIMRQIFYVRYIEYFITAPLLLTTLLLVSGLPTPTILYVLFMSEVMVIMGLVGALVKSTYKWGFYTFGCVAFLFVAFSVVWEGRVYARAVGQDVLRNYTLCSSWLMLIWLVYPVVWGVSEGGNIIPPDSEAISYGVLDILAKPVFAALFLFGLRNLDFARLGLHFRDGRVAPGAGLGEKHTAGPAVGEPVAAPTAAGTTTSTAV
ncbi:hypothetical protein HRR83_004179 [Exophiala dermatitidis]|uniref:Uncharacterized protein n=2 Tax=Exophiala dermatitidis TaxID=5970 RepID=H6BRB5_EXODN|nr:uncharacterized protein HMPREF1120_02861 [Exophiala dermatitidis NIH/UT8656]KAJ4511784.1 hypothetical protein HRR73_006360 [Exophiala dermatitidis]EHY54696.1 hypothetical protein HMPREF1120_02861 [Exophiala dermatitidis NIH/UT8656]KAJ4517840.1 hypothetical protein HRR75_003059 [Exophiala dermatitidis]KAJ4521517.1 hypothetical protein HRR74_003341 [Exophiala dermatitidis]KAJ4542193.1 hypothetical protein HRR77_006075 [Exophiala dermatitidis]